MPDPIPQELLAYDPEELFAYAMQNDVTNLDRYNYKVALSVMQFQLLSKLGEVAVAQREAANELKKTTFWQRWMSIATLALAAAAFATLMVGNV